MQRLHEQLGPRGLRVIAVSVDATPGSFDRVGNPGGNVEAFVNEMDLTFPIWRDPSSTISRVYRATGVPESFVIDRSGFIVRKVIGAFEWDSEAVRDSFIRLLEG
jgi:cytochrome c-type biogenesis protein